MPIFAWTLRSRATALEMQLECIHISVGRFVLNPSGPVSAYGFSHVCTFCRSTRISTSFWRPQVFASVTSGESAGGARGACTGGGVGAWGAGIAPALPGLAARVPSGRRVLFEALHGLGMGLSYRAGPGASVVVRKEKSSTDGMVVCPSAQHSAIVRRLMSEPLRHVLSPDTYPVLPCHWQFVWSSVPLGRPDPSPLSLPRRCPSPR